MGFFDIQDGLGEESFFAIDETENNEERNKTEPDGIPAYSISGSIKQDFIYGISEPGDEFNRNQEGIEKIYSEFFLQARNSLNKNSKIKLTELAYALEEIIVTPYKLTGYLEIDAKNVPISKSYRYSIPGLPSKGYEAGSRNPGAISKVFGAIFNPVDFLYNLFGKKPKQLKKLQLMKDDFRIRELLNTKFDRETLVELLQIEKFDIDEILRNCSYSESFIVGANDLQILEAISQCYEEFKLINRK